VYPENSDFGWRLPFNWNPPPTYYPDQAFVNGTAWNFDTVNQLFKKNTWPYLRNRSPGLEVQIGWLEGWEQLEITSYTNTSIPNKITIQLDCSTDVYVGRDVFNGWKITGGDPRACWLAAALGVASVCL
jgi:hypothetical protein